MTRRSGTVAPVLLAEPYADLGTSLRLNAVDEHGVEWWLEDVEGWDSPASSTEATQRAGGHGAWMTEPWLAARSLTLTGKAIAPHAASLRDAADRLARAVALEDFELVVHEHGVSRFAAVRRQGEVLWDYLNTRPYAAVASWSIGLVAADPLRYNTVGRQARLTAPVSTGGVALPTGLPLAIGARVIANRAAVTNAGNHPASPVLEFTGPLSAPVLTVGTGTNRQAIGFGIALAAGQRLVVDTARREVLLDGTASRLYAMAGDWIVLPPGTTRVMLTAASYHHDAGCTLTWRDTWN